MFALLWFVLAVLASPFKSKSRLEAENAALRHQLIVLRRKVRGAKYMIKRRGPPGSGWGTFLRNHAPDIAAGAGLAGMSAGWLDGDGYRIAILD